ncbi:Uncharacterised protein [Vibrio cholerae]|nr:Uncharacterised protein [Vibrio cholerae]CSI15984.1 Uncharacterised protein [Vibrio cholerae]
MQFVVAHQVSGGCPQHHDCGRLVRKTEVAPDDTEIDLGQHCTDNEQRYSHQ